MARIHAFSVLVGSAIAVVGTVEPAAWAANPHAAKQHAASSNAAQFPKGKASAGNASQGGGGEADVFSITTTADGVSHVESYTPAPGVTSDQLLANLAKAGKKGLKKDDGSGIAQGSSAACTYYTWNTAKTTCPSVHWANNGYTRPQVYFVDHTGPNGWSHSNFLRGIPLHEPIRRTAGRPAPGTPERTA